MLAIVAPGQGSQTPGFLTPWMESPSFADRLHVDANRNIGPAEGRLDTIAGQPAACADVPVVGGTVSYCALDAGVVGRYLGADVTIELTSFSTGG